MAMTNYDFTRPTRQSGVAMLLILLKFLRTILRSFWPILLVVLLNRRNQSEQWEQYILLGVAGISSISVVGSIIAFFRYYFRLTDDELIIEEGLFERKKTIIPFHHIQTINLEQGIVHQLFQVVQLKIDTAGAKGEEVTIEALDRHQAQALKSQILSGAQHTATSANEERTTDEQPRELVHLSVIDMLKAGVSQNHLQTAGVVLAFLIGFFDDIDELFNLNILDTVESWLGAGTSSMWLFITVIGPLFIIVSFLVSLLRTVIKYFDQRVWLSRDGLKLEAGLLTRFTTYIKPAKVQWLYWSQNPIYRRFGLHELKIKQAAGTMQDLRRTIQIPGCYQHQIETIKKELFAESMYRADQHLPIHPALAQRSFLIYGSLTTMLSFILVVSHSWLIALFLALGVWVLSYFYWRAYQRSWSCAINDEAILCNYGVWDHRQLILPYYKIQGVKLRQSPYQRQHHLATVVLDTASGQVTVPYLPLHLAQSLLDQILYTVEKQQRSWM